MGVGVIKITSNCESCESYESCESCESKNSIYTVNPVNPVNPESICHFDNTGGGLLAVIFMVEEPFSWEREYEFEYR